MLMREGADGRLGAYVFFFVLLLSLSFWMILRDRARILVIIQG